MYLKTKEFRNKLKEKDVSIGDIINIIEPGRTTFYKMINGELEVDPLSIQIIVNKLGCNINEIFK